MARRYSKKKGKSGSKKPEREKKPVWVKYTSKEVEQFIINLAKTGKKASQIGLILRDSYGIPSVREITNKRISKILEENNIKQKLPEDLMSLIKRVIVILKHLESNKHDIPSRRGLEITESKINKLIVYYKKSGKLPKDWNYERANVKMLIE